MATPLVRSRRARSRIGAFFGEEGFISVVVVIDSQSGKIVAGPDIHARGFTEDQALFDEVKKMIEKALAKAVAGGVNGTHQLQQVVRRTVGGWVGEEHRRKPMIGPSRHRSLNLGAPSPAEEPFSLGLEHYG
jgi:mRNA degradation ribonuclease J1/J2